MSTETSGVKLIVSAAMLTGGGYMLWRLLAPRPVAARAEYRKDLLRFEKEYPQAVHVTKGCYVNRRFVNKKGEGERMWVKVTSVRGNKVRGVLDSDPVVVRKLKFGSSVTFVSDEAMTVHCPISQRSATQRSATQRKGA